MLMRLRPPRATLSSSSAASDVYKRQAGYQSVSHASRFQGLNHSSHLADSYTHLRAHETPEHLVCRLLLEKKTTTEYSSTHKIHSPTKKQKNTNIDKQI